MPSQISLTEQEYQLKVLSESKETEYGKAIFTAVKEMLDKSQCDLNNYSIVSDENIKKDFRYLRGMVNALEKVLNIPEAAGKKFRK